MAKHVKHLLLAGLLAAQVSFGQHTVVFNLDRVPATPRADTVFVPGNFNGWNPGAPAFSTSGKTISVTLAPGTYEYKFTRGSWLSAESHGDGSSAANRRITVSGDTVVPIAIEGWSDAFFQAAPKSTAAANVHVLDTAFYMPQLGRHRRVSIYLPPGYTSSQKKYGVLYMHDGQNVFDAATSFSGEWGVDETLNALDEAKQQYIVVAIDHGGDKRMTEYLPYDTERWGKGEGDAYIDFLATTLKPYIDRTYRVKRGRHYTALAGSSMGGLISLYALLKHPKTFGVAGVFSPAFWVAPALAQTIQATPKRRRGRIYFYAGKQESERMVPDMLAVFLQLSKQTKFKMTTVIRTEGQHNEARWQQEFPLFYNWLLQ